MIKPWFVIIGVSAVVASAACRSTADPVARTDLNGSWQTADTASDQLSIDLAEGGEIVGGAGSVAFANGHSLRLNVAGIDLSDRICTTICTPIVLKIADTLQDTLFIVGHDSDATHFVGTTTSVTGSGPGFGAFSDRLLLFSRQ